MTKIHQMFGRNKKDRLEIERIMIQSIDQLNNLRFQLVTVDQLNKSIVLSREWAESRKDLDLARQGREIITRVEHSRVLYKNIDIYALVSSFTDAINAFTKDFSAVSDYIQGFIRGVESTKSTAFTR